MLENLNQKIINNAISAYLMLFISWMLLLNKTNKNINNSFVRSHTKTSIIIHLMIILNTIVFLIYKLFWNITLFQLNLNIIIATIIFILIWIIMVNWAYHAFKWENFEILKFINKSKWVNLNIDNNIYNEEKDKLNLLLCHIPFIWFIIWSKFKNNKIEDILKLNLFVTLIICLIYILWYINITNFLSLIYIIFIVFIWVNLYSRDELISINLPYYFLPSWKILIQKVIFKYFKNYFKWDFKKFETLKNEQIEKENKLKNDDFLYLENLEDVKLNKKLIYIPIIGLIFLFQKENKYIFHIRNAMIISLISIIILILIYFWIVSSKLFLLLLFPISFGIWELNNITYKMPYIYEIYRFGKYLKNLFKSSKEEINKRKKEVIEINLKVK